MKCHSNEPEKPSFDISNFIAGYEESNTEIEMTCPECGKVEIESYPNDRVPTIRTKICYKKSDNTDYVGDNSSPCYIKYSRKKDVDTFKRFIGVPFRYKDCTLDSFTSNSNIITEIRDIVNSGDYTQPLLFTGEITGTGKTHLCIATIVEIGLVSSLSMRFINFSELMGEIFESIKRDDSSSVDGVIKKYSTIGVLCIDDLGAEHTTAYSTSLLYRILNNRYNSMKMTIITTNLKGDEICDMYDRRIFSRMICGHVFTLSGKDKRKGIYKKVEV